MITKPAPDPMRSPIICRLSIASSRAAAILLKNQIGYIPKEKIENSTIWNPLEVVWRPNILDTSFSKRMG